MTYSIGIDVGGTFTDFLLTDHRGTAEVFKVLSTPDDPSVGLLEGLAEMAGTRGVGLADFVRDVSTIVHGTTVTTNAVLTRSGARTGLLTTRGLRDALEMRRGIREEQYDNRFQNVAPLVPRRLRRPVSGRLDYAGAEIEPLSGADVVAGLESFAAEGVAAVAICFMNAFANPEHERRAAAEVRRRLPGAYLTVSTELLPSIRFYDRVSTTVLNSYVGPILRGYLTSLTAKLAGIGFGGVLLIMQSNGGVVSPDAATVRAAGSLLSGPAGGPVAGIHYAGAQGHRDCITVDMGGTSFDAALIKDRTPLVVTEGEIDRLRIAMPMLGIVTIGAGGGSIGRIDEGGLLRMGPQSAGAKPGPACYGRGGELPTCTDADLLLGYLDPDFFAGGRMKLDRAAAETAVRKHIAGPLGLSVTEAAAGMYSVINVNMAAGVREVSVKRGHDPREFPLVVAGGAGPLHACQIAAELEIPLLIVPRESSILCAAGMLLSDLQHDFVRTCVSRVDRIDPARFRTLFREMEDEGRRLLVSENVPEERIAFVHKVDLRYVKQYHEVTVEVPAAAARTADLAAITKRFHPEHDRLYGYSLEREGTPVEVINLRLTCVGKTVKPKFRAERHAGPDPAPALKGKRPVYVPARRAFVSVPVYDGDRMRFGNRVPGPAVLEQANTTTVVMPEYSVACDRFGSFAVYLKSREREFLDKAVGGRRSATGDARGRRRS